MGRDAIDAYGLAIDIEDLGLLGVANRAVYVLDGDGEVSYAWTTDDPTVEPDYEELVAAVDTAA
jgi:peroxiredoxin